jgi:hypothetical protein
MRRLSVLVLALAAVLSMVTVARATPPPIAWCGSDESQADRLPDAVSSYQIHVVYAYPSDGPDRFGSLAGPIASAINAIDVWWTGQDPTRSPRFDLFEDPGCATTLGRLDLSSVRLPHDSSYFAPEISRGSRLAADIDNLGFVETHKKYIVLYDGPVEGRVCGVSPVLAFSGGIDAYSEIFLQGPCLAGDLGSVLSTSPVLAHELVHNLGALAVPGPPNACPGDPGHPCDSVYDLMYPVDLGIPLDQKVLDDGHDDYYGHSGAWFDVQDSSWLAHLDAPQYPLTVSIGGSPGGGSVTSGLPGISCPPACSIAWDSGTLVELTAVPSGNAHFAGWSGACTGSDPACSVTVSSAQAASARFEVPIQLTVKVVGRGGRGLVTSKPSGIRCPGTCSAKFDQGSAVVLTASARPGSLFSGWRGACGRRPSCTIALGGARTVQAVIVRKR